MLLLLAGLVVVDSGSLAHAFHVSCGSTIFSDTNLDSDIVNCFNGITIGSDNVTLDCQGHTIASFGAENNFGILALGRKGVTIMNCVVTNFEAGVLIGSSSDMTVLRTVTHDNAIGFRFFASDNSTLSSSTSQDQSIGFDIATSNSNSFSHNTAIKANEGFRISSSRNNVFDSNLASDNDSGFLLRFRSGLNIFLSNVVENNDYGFRVSGSNNGNSFTANTAAGNRIAGFAVLLSSNFNTFAHNKATNNALGFRIQSSTLNTFQSNVVEGNQIGIDIVGSSGNTIHDNFLDNALNARDDGTSVWNIEKTPGENIVEGPFLGGNFWSDYQGEDQDDDGLGDTLLPHTSAGNILNGGDFHPLVLPPAITVDIDIRPGVQLNRINVRSPGLVLVAILTSSIFDATSVHPVTVKFGRTGTEAAPAVVPPSLVDIDGDQDLDMLVSFNITQTGFKAGDTMGVLTGKTYDGRRIIGTDSVLAFFPGDVNGDLLVNILDMVAVGSCFGSAPESSRWNLYADFNENQIIDVLDLVVVGAYFGQHA